MTKQYTDAKETKASVAITTAASKILGLVEQLSTMIEFTYAPSKTPPRWPA